MTYAANTHSGLTRTYNEDRISIMLDLKPSYRKGVTSIVLDKPIMYFAVFDGHGGSGCADYLRDNLHRHIAKSNAFPYDLKQAIRDGCQEAERYCLSINEDELVDKSGSCALVCLLQD